MRKVICNTTPLIALADINQFGLLRDMYGEIYIPRAVYNELKSENVKTCVDSGTDWVHVLDIKDKSQKKMYRAKLHSGEVEVMILAQEQDADLVILDDDAAKKTAKYLGLTTTGTLGILIKAKKEGKITAISPILEDLVNTGFFISDKVKTYVLEIAGEI